MRMGQSGTWSEDFSPYKSGLFWIREHTFPFYWRLKTVSLTGAETPKEPHQIRAEWSRAACSTVEKTGQSSTGHSGVDQRKWSKSEKNKAVSSWDRLAPWLPCPKAVLTDMLLHSHTVPQPWCLITMLLHNWAGTLLNCSTDVIFSQQCYITTDPLAQNKVSFFTSLQKGDTYWRWNGTKDHYLQKKIIKVRAKKWRKQGIKIKKSRVDFWWLGKMAVR